MTEPCRSLTRRGFLRVAGVVAGLAVTGCQVAAPPASQTTAAGSDLITVTYWDPNTTDEQNAPLDTTYAKFNEIQQKIHVDVEHGKNEEAVLASVAAGSPPDVYWRWNVNTYGSWINKGVVQDLTDFVQASQLDLTAFVPISLEIMKWRDKYYGMPLTSAGIGVLFWHKKLLEDAGLDPTAIPESLDELMEFSDKLTVRDGAGEITRLGFHPRLVQVEWPALFNAQFWDPTAEKITPTDPGMIAAFEWEANWYQHYGVETIDRFLAGLPDYYSGAQPLCSQLVAMHGGYEWDYLYLGLKCQIDEFGYGKVAHPAGHADYPTCSQGAIALVIPTGAPQPQAGWSFIEYLESYEATAEICAGLVNVAQRLDAVKLPAYQDNPILKFASEQSTNVKAWPANIPVAAEYATELDKARDLIVHGKISAQDGLQAVYDQVQPVLDKALGKA